MGSLCDQLAQLISLFTDADHRLYVVGGWVRDHLLAEASPARQQRKLDVDLTTDALPDTTAELLRRWSPDLWLAGVTFGTVGATRDGVVVEVTTHRAEEYDPQSRNPAVRFSDDISVDLSRRDFTVNAMAVALPTGDLVDPFGGADDLAARRLRAPSEPHGLFADDPLRILRAARFVATLNLEADPTITAAMTAERARLAIVKPERQAMELTKLLALPTPGAGVALLASTGVLADIFGWLRATDRTTMARRIDRLAHSDNTTRVALRLAALAFDAAPHELERVQRRLSVALTRQAASLIAVSRDLCAVDGSDPSLRRVLADHPDTFEVAAELLAAVDRPVAAQTLARLSELRAIEGLPAVGTPLDGNDVMRLAVEHGFTISGPAVGEALRFLTERHIAAGPLTPEQAEGALVDHWRDDTGTSGQKSARASR